MKIEDIKKITLDEGDVLAVKIPDGYDNKALTAIRESLREIFPNNKSIVYTDDIEFQKISGGK